MNEQRTRVEALDPGFVVSTLGDYLALAHQALRNERFLAVALSKHATLSAEAHPDVDVLTRQGLTDAKAYTCDTLTWLREEHCVGVSVFDPENNGWYRILGIGINWESFCMVAWVYDPQDPDNSEVTKWLGPAPALACSPLETAIMATHQPPRSPIQLELTDHLQRPFLLRGQAELSMPSDITVL